MSFLDDYPHLQKVYDLSRLKRLKVYLVGGFLRDTALKRECFDFDFAVSKNAVSFARQFARSIKGAFVLLDEEHGCARVIKKEAGHTWTYDFADFRGKDIKKDLAGRDFTINTLALDIKDAGKATEKLDRLLDAKKAKSDLKARRIRVVSPRAFTDDPLRMLRAFSLQALLGFKIEPKTLTQIKRDRDLIRDVSRERVRDEFFKILESPDASKHLKALDKIKLLEKVIPQIVIMYRVKQGTYHHLDVYKHSLETCVQLDKLVKELGKDAEISEYLTQPLGGNRSRLAVLRLAALLHDIGKPETRKRERDRISFHGHERVGKSIVRTIAKDLKLSTKERFALQDMVLWHLRPGYLSNFKSPSKRAVFRYFRNTKEEAASIAILSLADQRATRGPATTQADQKHHEKICLGLVEEYFRKLKEEPFVRLIDGNDLIRTLKLTPSPLFKKILDKVEELQAAGTIKTKDEALTAARKMAE